MLFQDLQDLVKIKFWYNRVEVESYQEPVQQSANAPSPSLFDDALAPWSSYVIEDHSECWNIDGFLSQRTPKPPAFLEPEGM